MYTNKNSTGSNKVLTSTLATLGWLSWMLGWMALAWRHYSFFQNLASLGISTLVFVAIVGVMWVGGPDTKPTATILVTLGGLIFVLYWIGFVWSRHTLLQNGAVLLVSYLVWQGLVGFLWLAGPADETC
jgi:hypothetical protein